MATYYSDKCSATTIVQPRGGIDLTGMAVAFSLGANTAASALAAGDICQMIKVPKGAVIYDMLLSSDGIGSGSVSAAELGDGVDTDRFMSSPITILRTAGGVSRITNPAGAGYQYTADDTIDLKIDVAETGGYTYGTIRLQVWYSMQDDV